MNNAYFKLFFWIFPIILVLNVVADFLTRLTGHWYDLLAIIPTIYIGIPAALIFIAYFIALSIVKKADSRDKAYFKMFFLLVVLLAIYPFVSDFIFNELHSF